MNWKGPTTNKHFKWISLRVFPQTSSHASMSAIFCLVIPLSHFFPASAPLLNHRIHLWVSKDTLLCVAVGQQEKSVIVRIFDRMIRNDTQMGVHFNRRSPNKKIITILFASSYLRCDKNFPVECPDPSQPGIGHLQRKNNNTGMSTAPKCA